MEQEIEIEEGEGVPNFAVIGWYDGTSFCKFCLNFADAMNTYNEQLNLRPHKRNWFLEITMFMRVDYKHR